MNGLEKNFNNEMGSVKIIQINAWCGRLSTPLARFIKDEQPDIICMQEVFKPKGFKANVFDDQYNFLEEIKAASGLEYGFFAPTWGFALGDTTYDSGKVILSRFPIKNESSEYTNGEYHVWDKETPKIPNTRTCQTCSLVLPDGVELSLLNYQGYLDGPHGIGTNVTVKTMELVRDIAAKLPRPLIMCGDLNVWPSSPALSVLDSLGLRNLTVEHDVNGTLSDAHRAPAEDRVVATCDYILISPEIQEKDFSVSEEVVSDHKALILEFEI